MPWTAKTLRTNNRLLTCLGAVLILLMLRAPAGAEETYRHYFGSAHSHSYCSDGGKETQSDHFTKAKAAGYDFYAVTDHALAKYPNFTPQTYEETRRLAEKFTDEKFVALAGFEFSENDGPGGKGHINVLGAATYLDATGPKVNIPIFYDWLVKNASPTVAATFNHGGRETHSGYADLTPERRGPMAMYEVINSGKLHYEGYLAALRKGWRVAPAANLDAHGTWRITNHHYRTGVLATALTRDAILQAMRARRVYCTWDSNLRITVTVNGQIMGSVLRAPARLAFSISVSDPDTGEEKEKITKVEIVGDNEVLVAAKEFADHAVKWDPTFDTVAHPYYLVKVFTADEADGPGKYEQKKPPASKKAGDKGKTPPPSKQAAASAAPPARTEFPTAYAVAVWIEST